MNKMLLYTLLLVNLSVYIQGSQARTHALHAEMHYNMNPILTQETHPIMYAMVKNLATAAHINMPKYITVYGAQGLAIAPGGILYTYIKHIGAWVDIFGDLHICYEILSTLPYEVIEGIIAVAFAEKTSNKLLKSALFGCRTFAITIPLVYCIIKYIIKSYDLKLSSFAPSSRYNHNSAESDIFAAMFFYLVVIPALVAAKIEANNIQKCIDIKATEFTDTQRVIAGIKGLIQLKNAYIKENFLSRIASALKLTSIYNFLCYPIRAYTSEERLQYLSALEPQA